MEAQYARDGIVPGYMLAEIASRSEDPKLHASMLSTKETTARLLSEKQIKKPNEQLLLPGIISARHRLHREVWDARQSNEKGVQLRIEGSRNSGDVDVDMCYDFAGLVFDYYAAVHDHISLDGEGLPLVSRVHFRADPPAAFNSAFWNGSMMTYGSGDGVYFNSFVHRFVAAHEFTHGVTEYLADFFKWGQAATLNEHVSDAFAALIEMWADKITADKYHWIAVKGIHREGIKSVGLRHMRYPGSAFDDPRIGKDRQPDHMSGYVQTTDDTGGAHINNGILNRAFAEFCIAVGGYAWESAAPIWFYARNHAGHKPTFASFAGQTLIACDRLGLSKHKAALEQSWQLVGILPDRG